MTPEQVMDRLGNMHRHDCPPVLQSCESGKVRCRCGLLDAVQDVLEARQIAFDADVDSAASDAYTDGKETADREHEEKLDIIQSKAKEAFDAFMRTHF